MDAQSPLVIDKAVLRGMIAKGNRAQMVIDAMKCWGRVYFAATGGAGALIAEKICKARVV
jgi:fumarate hydratase subunit beta